MNVAAAREPFLMESLRAAHEDNARLIAENARLAAENEWLKARVELFARWCSSLAGGAPLDVQLRMEEHA